MTENTILNTDMFTKIVIKNEDDDTVVAVITADDVEPAPLIIGPFQGGYTNNKFKTYMNIQQGNKKLPH